MLNENMLFGLKKARYEAGQVLIIVILVVVVALTIGLSLASRTITNLRTTTEEAESQKALAAAEVGIERAIKSHLPVSSPILLDNGASYVTTVNNLDGTSFLLSGGNVISKDSGVDVWFQAHDTTTEELIDDYKDPSNAYLYWGENSITDCGTASAPSAIEVIVITTTSGVIKTHRYAFDPCPRGNGFKATDSVSQNFTKASGDTVTLRNRTKAGDLMPIADINRPLTGEKVIFMRVLPIYKDTRIALTNGNPLPLQGYQIESTGTAGNPNNSTSASKTVRKIMVFKGWPQTYLPYLSFGLFVARDKQP